MRRDPQFEQFTRHLPPSGEARRQRWQVGSCIGICSRMFPLPPVGAVQFGSGDLLSSSNPKIRRELCVGFTEDYIEWLQAARVDVAIPRSRINGDHTERVVVEYHVSGWLDQALPTRLLEVAVDIPQLGRHAMVLRLGHDKGNHSVLP